MKISISKNTVKSMNYSIDNMTSMKKQKVKAREMINYELIE